MRAWHYRVAVALGLVLASAAYAATSDDGVRVVTLKNGVRVLLAPDSLAAAVDVGVWYPAGVRTEREGRSGLTYLLGRRRFAAPGAADARTRLEAEGAVLNTNINPDFTGASETVPAGVLEQALAFEAKRMTTPAIDDAALKSDVDAVRAERGRRIGSSAVGRGIEALYATAFAGHPYARPVIGRDEDLARLTTADVTAYAADRFDVSRAVVSIVGRCDPDQALAAARKDFEGLRATTPPPASKDVATPMPAQTSARRKVVRASTTVPILIAGWRGPADSDPDNPALEVLLHALAGGPTAALGPSLTGEGQPLAQLQGDFDRRRDACVLMIAAAVRTSADSAEAEQGVVAAVEKYAREPLPEADLAQAKRQVEAGMVYGAQGARGRAQALVGAHMLSGDWQAWQRRVTRVRELTAADVQRAARATLQASRRSVVWVKPEKAGAAKR
jgi:zinc protease